MPNDNSTDHVLRFVQLRPATRDVSPETGPVELGSGTPLGRRLAGATQAERRRIALGILRNGVVESFVATPGVDQLVKAAKGDTGRKGTVAELASAVDMSQEALSSLRELASDVLLALKYGSQAKPGQQTVETAFRAAAALTDLDSLDPEGAAIEALRRGIVLPASLARPVTTRGDEPSDEAGHGHGAVPTEPPSVTPARPGGPLVRLLGRLTGNRSAVVPGPGMTFERRGDYDLVEELIALAQPTFLNLPNGPSTQAASFTLNDAGRQRLSPSASEALAALRLNTTADTLDRMLMVAQSATAATRARPVVDPVVLAVGLGEEVAPALRDVGVADLLVLKQHLTAYERVDIAHIETVLDGETKARVHRRLERKEETLTVDRETTHEQQNELQTAERLELNREVARTVQRDQEFGFGLTVSGKYGPTVEFSSNLEATSATSTQESTSSATRYAKDVMERALERVVERVREEQVRRILREEEESNHHRLKNESGQHINGVYQFLEKVYENQIFNYGLMQMFDFMVPEPASYVWSLEGSDEGLSLPTPPPSLDAYVPSPGSVNAGNYLSLAARFHADGVAPPPSALVTATSTIVHGQDAPDNGEEGEPRSVMEEDLAVPAGYRPYRAFVRPTALTDKNLSLAVTVGHTSRVWRPGNGQIALGSSHKLGTVRIDLSLLADSYPYEAAAKLPVQVVAFETNSYAVAIEVVFIRTPTAYVQWQLKTYEQLADAYNDSMARYESTVADLRAEAEAKKANAGTARFGAPPSQNLKTIKTELKKHCISIVTRQRFEEFNVVQDGMPPIFDFDEAAQDGAFTRFFEQAFEWDQLQYVCYPYYWSHPDRRAPRFLRQDIDPVFLEFLQAGSARVVVPVRPGFEVALTHYLETGELWNGAGQPPLISDPLYVPIIVELQERTDAPQGEVAVGEPWQARLPTPLVILRTEQQLPAWQRTDTQTWDWQEA